MLSRDFVHRIIKADVTPAKPEEDVPFELRNIKPHEVSFVDKAANRRTFLVKKKDQKPKAEEAVVVDADDIVDLTQTAKGEAPGADLDRADAEKARLAKEAEEKEQSEREKAIAAKAEAQTPPAKPADKPAEAPGDKPDDKPADDKPADDKPAQPEKTVETVVPGTEPTDPAVKPPVEPVAKVGRKMARARLERLTTAFKTLQDLIAEVVGGDEEEAPAKKEEEAVAATPATSQVPVVEAKANPEIAELTKSLAAQQTTIQNLNVVVENLTKTLQQQGEILAKSRLPVDSNTISLEKSDFGHDKVIWDADMASPRALKRGRSF